jgi:pimeloyl-ACP methyl ester carboxylesterase
VRVVVGTVVAVVVLYAGACLGLYLLQRSLIYFPQPRRFGTPDTVMTLRVPDALLNISVRPLAGRNAVLYFGGNAEDVSANLPGFTSMFPDRALYLVHYRGYGGSSGQPSEQAVVADALAVFDKIRAEHPNITVIGRSMGSGVAVQLASQRPVSRLVLVTPYDSVLELAAQQYPYFPVRWLLIDKFESWRYVPKISTPTLVLAAEQDEVIPLASSERLYGRFARGIASYQVIPGAGHNTISDDPAYMKALADLPQR